MKEILETIAKQIDAEAAKAKQESLEFAAKAFSPINSTTMIRNVCSGELVDEKNEFHKALGRMAAYERAAETVRSFA